MNLEQSFVMNAKTFLGLEEVLAEELADLGAKNIEIGQRVVKFEGDLKLLYSLNLWVRSALRILVPVYEFKAQTEQQLYRQIYAFDWENYLTKKQSFVIDSVVKSPYFNHSHYAALKVKDAIADRFREKYRIRPSVDTKNPDIRVNLYIHNDDVIISLDSSGNSLHKRGYRKQTNMAPLNEVTAAALVLMSGYRGDSTFVEPMCGSGTILCEALMIACNKAPGANRNFAFENWQNFEPSLWVKLKRDAENSIIPLKHHIYASDISSKNIDITKQNTENLNLDIKEMLRIKRASFEGFSVEEEQGIMVMNPPYGERMKKEEILDFYKMIGDSLKQRFQGFHAWVLSSNKAALKRVGLKPSSKKTVFNGSLECGFWQFSIYGGSKKQKYQS